MRHSPHRKSDYLKAGQLFHWASPGHYILWFTGSIKRHKRTEVMLPRLVREGRLRAVRYGRILVYAVPRISKGEYHIEHGLACTEGLVRFWRSDMNGVVVPERFFRGLRCIPEWGIIYDNSILLYEYCSADQFTRGRKVEGKVVNYNENLHTIEQKFGKPGVVVFVIDANRAAIEKWVSRVKPTGPFFFTDYEAFTQVPIGQQLTAEIYFWEDGKVYPLR